MAKSKELKGDIQKLALGEIVNFEDVVVTKCETRFGESAIVNFANSNGEIIRKCFAQGGMLEHLKQNPQKKSIMLKKKLTDGDYTYNVWE